MLTKVYDDVDRLTLTAPVGGVIGGKAYRFGRIFGFARSSVAQGKPYVLDREGVFRVSIEAQGADIAIGDNVYFEAGRADSEFHNDGTDVGGMLVGTALEAVPAGSVKTIDTLIEPCHNAPIA